MAYVLPNAIIEGALQLNDTSASGNYVGIAGSGATTVDRTATVEVNDADRIIDLGGDLTIGGDLTTANTFTTTGAFPITLNATAASVATLPTGTTTLASQQYVNDVATGLDVKLSCRLSTTVGDMTPATLSFTSPTLTITGLSAGAARGLMDGVEPVDGDRILIKDGGSAGTGGSDVYNGLWSVTGGTTTSLTLVRTTDADEDFEVTSGMFSFVTEGTSNGGNGWLVVTGDPIIVGTDPLTFTQFSGAGQLVEGDGIDIAGNVISVDLKANSGLSFDVSQLQVDLKANGGVVFETGELAVDLGATSITGTLGTADGGTGATSLDGANIVRQTVSAGNNNLIPVSDGPTRLIKSTGVSIDASDNMTGVANLTATGTLTLGASAPVVISPTAQAVSRTLDVPLLSANDTFVFETHTQTLSNKTLTDPKINTSIRDLNNNELVVFMAAGSAVNEFTITNAAASANPTFGVSGSDTNIGIDFTAKGDGGFNFSNDLKVDTVGDGAALIRVMTELLVNQTTTRTYTADEVLRRHIRRSGQNPGTTDTLPTAALLVAGLPFTAKVGDTFTCTWSNEGTKQITLAAGTGGSTIPPTLIIKKDKSITLTFLIENVSGGTEAYTVFTDQGSPLDSHRDPVRVATAVAGVLATDFDNGSVVDGITLATGDRVLIKDQANGVENGVYIVNAAGAPTRDSDYAAGLNSRSTVISVEEGDTNADTIWLCINDEGADIIDTDALRFKRISSTNELDGLLTVESSLEKPNNIDGADLGGTHAKLYVDASTREVFAAQGDIASYTYAEDLTLSTGSTLSLTGTANHIYGLPASNVMYVGAGGNLHVVNTTTITAMTLDESHTDYASYRGMDINGTDLWVAVGVSGVARYDITTPHAISFQDVSDNGDTASSVEVYAGGTRLLVATDTGFYILNISTPSAPVLIGTEVAVASGTPTIARVNGTTVYVGAGDGSLYSYDISVEAAPSLLDSVDVGGAINELWAETVDGRQMVWLANDSDGLRVMEDSQSNLIEIILDTTSVSQNGIVVDSANSAIFTASGGDGVLTFTFADILAANALHITSQSANALVIDGETVITHSDAGTDENRASLLLKSANPKFTLTSNDDGWTHHADVSGYEFRLEENGSTTQSIYSVDGVGALTYTVAPTFTTGMTTGADIIFDETTNDLTLAAADQTTGTATATIPDLGGVSGDIVINNATQTLTNKTLTAPVLNSVPTFSLDDTDSAFDLTLESTSTLGADSTLTFDTEGTDRTLRLGGNLVIGGAFSTSGVSAITLTSTGATNVTLPTTGTLSTLAGTETLTNKTLTTPILNAVPTFSLDDTDSAFNLTLESTSTLGADSTLTFDTETTDRLLRLGGDLYISANFTTSGGNAVTLVTTGVTSVTMPTSGTLATLAGVETFTNKTITGATNTVSANNLKTTGADVAVASASPPTTGQVLQSTSATSATWQYRGWREPVRVATTTAGVLASSFEDGDTIDGVVLATGDRILIKNQGAGVQNGIYVVNASGAPTRAADYASTTAVGSTFVIVQEGTANGDSMWICTNNDGSDTVDTDALTFADVGASSGGETLAQTLVIGNTTGGNDIIMSSADTLNFSRTNTLILDAATVTTTNRTVTFPDPGADDSVVYLALTQTLTNKTLTTPTITNATLSLDDTATASTLSLVSTSATPALTADRSLTFNVKDANRTITLAGNLSIAGNLTTAGSNPLTLITTAATNVTLPLTGTLATLAGTETFTNKTITSPIINQITTDGTEEVLIFADAGAAVNEFTITNATTGNAPQLSATGDNTNIGIDLLTKGTGVFSFRASSATKSAELRLYDNDSSNYIAVTVPAAVTPDRTHTIPNTANDTFAMLAATQTLTNKTITAASNNVAANSLKTTGSSVTVSTAAPPTTGQVLGATSATTAAWQYRGWRQSVRVATTAAGTLASSFENGDTIDGVVLATGNRILIKNQAVGTENGIYVVNATGAPTRASDFAATTLVASTFVVVQEGTANADTLWVCTNNTGTDTVGTHALTFTEPGATGALASVLAVGNTTGGNDIVMSGASDTLNFTRTNNLILDAATVATTDRTVTFPDPGGNDSVVYTALTQTLTNKTLTTPTINGATLSLDDTDSAFNLNLRSTSTIATANKTLTFDVNNADRTISLGGNITTANSFTTLGNFALILTQTAPTNVTLPTTGTLATLAGTETLTNKTITGGTNTVSADNLKTTGSDVDVVSAAPPTTGQVLTATSATTATWQTPTSSVFTTDTAQTTTGAAVIITTIATTNDTSYFVNAHIAAMKTGTTDKAGGFVINALYRNDGGTLSLMADDYTNLGDYSVDASLTGTNIELEVIGMGGETVEWTCTYRVTTAS